MKYTSSPMEAKTAVFKGKEIKEGDVIESEVEMSKTQFEKVGTPKKKNLTKK